LEKLKAMPATLAVFERAPLRLFLNRAKLLDTGMAQWRPVILNADIEENTVAFRHASTLGDIQDRMAAEFTGGPLPKAPIGFGLKSMADVCEHVRTDQVKMALRGPLQPAVITEEIGGTVVTHILLPVRPHSVQDAPEATGEQVAPPAPPPIVSADDF
jgi:hypothetical protein